MRLSCVGYDYNKYPNFLGTGPVDNLRTKRIGQKPKVTEYTIWRKLWLTRRFRYSHQATFILAS